MILFYCLLVGVIFIGGAVLILGTAQDLHRPQWPAWLQAARPRHRTDRWALLRRARGWLA